ncbi:MAG: DUF6056 family protein [Solobacterium sp.]|nr:DUF6056 family protein [Solobacterium sp.]
MKTVLSLFEAEKKKNRIVLICIAVLILLMNLFTIKIADDYVYSQSSGLFDIFAKEYTQYMTWNGRSVAHILARISLILPRILFQVCNTLIFVWLIILIVYHSKPSQKHVPFLLATSFGLVFIFAPMFGETVLWQTGSFNYLWMTALILTFLIPYRQNEKHHSLFAGLYLLFGIIAGWTNENTGGAMILFIMGILLKNFIFEKEKPQLWKLTGLIGACAGLLIMVKAPGNAVRMLSFPERHGLSSLLISAYEASLVIRNPGNSGLCTLWLIFAAVITIAGILNKDKKKLYIPALFAVCSFSAVYAMIFSPVYINFSRSMFGATIFLICGIISCLALILNDQRADIPCKASLGILIALSAMNYSTAIIDLVNTRYQFRNWDRYISEQKKAGNLNPVIPALSRELMTPYDPIFDLEGIQGDHTNWINENFSVINGLESISSTTLDQWNRIYRDGDPSLMNIVDYETYLNAALTDDDRIVLVMTTDVSDESYRDMIDKLCRFLSIDPVQSRFFMAGISTDDSHVLTDNEELCGGITINGHYIYLSSMEDPEETDIVYVKDTVSNKNPGITISVYSKQKQQLVDEITWTPETYDHGIRSCSEQYNKRDNVKD